MVGVTGEVSQAGFPEIGRESLRIYHAAGLTFHPLILLLISMVPDCAVCITCNGASTYCAGKIVDVTPALRSFGLNAAGVIISSEGWAICKTLLNSVGKALPASPTTCTTVTLEFAVH